MYETVITFWFLEIKPKQWWKKDEDFDATLQRKFGCLHRQARAGELFQWRETALGCLAEIIIFDQFSRNMYRGKPQSFVYDSQALILAQTAISKGFDLELPEEKRGFLYMPFMHSESRLIHEEAVKLYELLGNPKKLEFEHRHKAIIDRFGRYPHRNDILGRESTLEEIEFLKQPN